MLDSGGHTPVASTGALLVRGSALQVASLLAGIAVSFYMMPFLIHALGDRWYGIWALIGSITSYYALLDFGLTSAVTRFLTQALTRAEKTDANAVIVTGLVIFGGIGALAFSISIAVALAGPWFFTDAGEAAAFRQAVLVLGADVALMFPFAVFNAVLAGHYRFDIASAVQLSALAVRTALIVYFISHGYSILALAVITLAVNLPSRVAVAVAARRLLPSLELSLAHFRPDRARELFGYGKYTFIAATADRLRFQVDTMVVAWFLGVGLVTHYAIAARVTQLFVDLVVSIMGVVAPLFMRSDAVNDLEKTRATLVLSTRLSVVASITTAGAIVIFGERFIDLWIGEAYRDAYWPMVILTGSLAVALMQAPSVTYLYASAKHWYYAYMTTAEAIANLALSLILVQFYGMIGVSLGTANPLLVANLFFQPWYVCRSLDLELRSYFRELLPALLLTAGIQIPLWIGVRAHAIPSLAVMLFLIVCYYPVCFVVLFYGIFTRTDRQRIVRAVPALGWLQSGARA